MDLDARGARGHLGERGRETRGAAVLQGLDEPAIDELDARLDQLLARERVTDLHRRALVGAVCSQLLAREDGCAADAVASGRRPVENDEPAGAARLRPRHARARKQSDAHRVDEAVVRVCVVEDGFAADGGHPNRVPVRADSCHCALERVIRRAEAKPVEQRDRPRAHRDDVAQNPADARRRALERLDGRRMIVRLDLERDRFAVAEVDHAGVLAGPLEDALSLGRQPPQEQGGMLVAAVLGPEQREDRELEVVRLAFQEVPDSLELAVREPQRTVQRLFRNLRQEPSLARRPDGSLGP